MREYESVFVLNPSVEDAVVDAELEKIKEFLSSKGSEITEVQKWGRRKLAYEVKKNREGIYTLIRFNADSGVPTELDRRYRLNENMLRYLTVLYERPAAGEGDEAAGEPGAGKEEGKTEAKEAPKPEAKAETKAEPEAKAEPAPEAAAAAEPGKAEDTQETQEKTETTPPSGNTEA
jgi:small subunit ribosomal protein S6